MSVTYDENDETQVVEFTVDGHLSRADFDRLSGRMLDFADRHSKFRMIEVVRRFPTFDPSILLPGIRFDLRILGKITHIAVVTDLEWISPFVSFAGMVTPPKMRMFKYSELEAARIWAAQADRPD
ncbi:STAS/SEC14 domain-containing protein [Antarctobacter jejuensis]|uniref:STAS/SEC14 domain-containing protein n=1 Tax=Antarctobacter jejuensis TaxID=1439938 RepID=UPI003FD66E34